MLLGGRFGRGAEKGHFSCFLAEIGGSGCYSPNMYSPQMGQSQSVERSMHLWDFSIDIAIQTPQV